MQFPKNVSPIDSCKELTTRPGKKGLQLGDDCYIKGISRGSPLHPNETTTNFVLYSYIITNKFTNLSIFTRSVSQRERAMGISLNS